MLVNKTRPNSKLMEWTIGNGAYGSSEDGVIMMIGMMKLATVLLSIYRGPGIVLIVCIHLLQMRQLRLREVE